MSVFGCITAFRLFKNDDRGDRCVHDDRHVRRDGRYARGDHDDRRVRYGHDECDQLVLPSLVELAEVERIPGSLLVTRLSS